MRFFKRHIIQSVVAIFSILGLASCVNDFYEPGPTIPPDPDDYLIILRINAVNAAVTGSEIGDHNEMVKSLRIVMLNNGAVELNQYIVPGDEPQGINMSDLDYILTARTYPGNKKFYLFANEESVGELKFESTESLPTTLPTNLHTYLKSVTPDLDNAQAGKEFENIINAVYFQPDYAADNTGKIYLPYTAYYDGYEVSADAPSNAFNPLQMYLVPVATKFIFQFVNYRFSDVEINNITVSRKNSDNFLFGHVNSPDYTKSFEGKDYYWVNWLAKVSEASHENADFYENVSFNEKYGWISHYDIPTDNNLLNAVFVEGSNVKTVPAGEPIADSEDIKPNSLTVGPFYAPESWNAFTYHDGATNEDVTVQRYLLTLGIHDVDALPGRDPVFENVTIDNLQALFRNTCVLIKVTMSTGKVEVYAEINPWNIKTANGWLVEGNAPSNNPF